jgi:hypothetical protein
MQSRHTFRAAALLAIFGILSSARASRIPESKPIADSATAADAVLLVTVLDYKPLDRRFAPEIDPRYPGRTVTADDSQAWPRGNYRLQVDAALKGNLKGELSLELPAVNEFYLGVVGMAQAPAGNFMLLLKHQGDQWKPVEPLLPMIPVSPRAVEKARAAEKGFDYIDVLLNSTDDPLLRHAALYLLRDITDKRIVPEAFKWINDANSFTRGDALLCMATNQDLRAIPLIVAWQDDAAKNNKDGTHAVNGLMRYRTPEAVSILAPLLTGHSQPVRDCAIQGLVRSADQSSIPFLKQLTGPGNAPDVSDTAQGILRLLEQAAQTKPAATTPATQPLPHS